MIAAAAIVLYFAAMLAIGWWAERGAEKSTRGYYLAGGGLGATALFFALFGTNCSPFVLMGIPGQSYHDGLAVFSLNAPIIALGIPLTFWLVGVPARAMALRLDALSPAELYAKRLDSRAAGLVLAAAFVVFTLPYMVTGIQGCGIALERQFDGALGARAGAVLTLVVALAYTLQGGMRATAWTNVVQGALFLLVMLAVGAALLSALGGPQAAFERLAAERPDLAVLDSAKPRYAPPAFASYGLAITLTVVCFPHMLARLMAAKSEATLRTSCRLYPLALVLLWTPAVLVGVFGALLLPGLVGRASDGIFPAMVERLFGPEWEVAGVLAVLAAAMSTLDAQLLTLGSLASREFAGGATSGARVGAERRFLVGVGVAVYALYEVVERLQLSIFELAQFSFSGYVMLFPTIVLGLVWRRFTATGAIASIVGGTATLALCQWGGVPLGGWLPVAPAFVVSSLLAVLASLATRPPDAARVRLACGD